MNWFSLPAVLISFVAYVLPVVIYRYCIRKKPLEHHKAKRITVWYAVICGILAMIITRGEGLFQGFIVFFASFLNYVILWGVKDNPKTQTALLQLLLHCGFLVPASCIFLYFFFIKRVDPGIILFLFLPFAFFSGYLWNRCEHYIYSKPKFYKQRQEHKQNENDNDKNS